MDRRAFLANLGLSVAIMASSCGFSLEDGLFNPCLSDPLPERLRSHELVRAAWDGIQPSRCWDCHVHLAGVGDGDDGVWITPQMKSLLHPWQNLQRRFYLNAACAETEGRVDEEFVRRLEHCLEAFPSGAKIMLLAFDFHHDASGARRDDLSAFRIADRYAAELAQRRPDRMEWICSIHPYREDVLEALAWAAQRGARAVKWLPSAMGMDPASPRCDVFYDQLTRLKLPLLTHAGAEQAVHGGSIGEYNNPLRLRRPLERGVRVIMAHCASLGEYPDTDRGADGPKVPAFALFARLMDEPRYQGELYGDISATVQLNRVGTALATLLARNDWHPRLINGSDYPLPGVLPLVSMRRFVEQGYLKQAEAGVLAEIRRYNPLLFDFVLKRSLVKDGGSFAPQVFESRRAFVQEA
jgi:uncharacterized protein